MKKVGKTFGERAVGFYKGLKVPEKLPPGVGVVQPYAEAQAWECTQAFYEKFYDDNRTRTFVLGINPGRFGSGTTGVPFTDAGALKIHCGIENTIAGRAELSSEFVYKVIEKWGGAQKFFEDFFLSAISPLGFVKDGKNFNYYDDAKLFEAVRPFIVKTLKEQIEIGAGRRAVVLFGSGKNAQAFEELNKEFRFFENIYALEHPRFVMQYKRGQMKAYVEKYLRTFERARRENGGG